MAVRTHGYRLLIRASFAEGLHVSVEVQHGRSFVIPTRHHGVPPKITTPWVVHVPAQRLMTRVAGEVVRGVDLDAVSIGIAKVQVERIRHTVSAGTTFEAALLVERTEEVGDMEDVMGLGDRKREVVQSRRRSLCRGDVVNRLLSIHPRREQLPGCGVLDGFRKTEAKLGVPTVRTRNVVGHQVDVIETIDRRAVPEVVALMVMSRPCDFMEVLDHETERIFDANGGSDAERRTSRKAAHLAAPLEMKAFGPIDIFRRAHAEGKARACRDGTNPKYEAVVDKLLVSAQVQRVGRFGAHDKPQAIHPESTAALQVADDQFRIGRAHDIGHHDLSSHGGIFARTVDGRGRHGELRTSVTVRLALRCASPDVSPRSYQNSTRANDCLALMKLANLKGRAALIFDATALDVAEASGGTFGPGIASVYENWDAFSSWTSTVDRAEATPFALTDLGPISPHAKQVFAVGLNYRAHAAEGGREVPKAPAVFTKYQSCLGAPFASVSSVPGRHDWEAELVVVIGRQAKHVAAEDAWNHVAGVTCGQDYSERDTQNASGGHFSLGKSFPGFGPTGPWLVTPDELANPDDLAISCEVSGEVMQSSRTSNMVFPVAILVEHLSSIVTLFPGDIIFTGTPEGVGFARKPPRLLVAGDVVVTTIERIGSIQQSIV